jgi:hypothetical protein
MKPNTTVYTRKYPSDIFRTQNGLKQGGCFRLRKVQENQEGVKSNGTRNTVVYAVIV